MDGLKLCAYGFNLLDFRIKGISKPLEKLRELDVVCYMKTAESYDDEVSCIFIILR